MLNQMGDNRVEHPIAYTSHKLKPRETWYSTIEKECLAIVWAINFFKTFLYGQGFTLFTDHNALTWLNTKKNSNSRLTCWALVLQDAKFKIHHQPGSQHKNVDGLSRGGGVPQSSPAPYKRLRR